MSNSKTISSITDERSRFLKSQYTGYSVYRSQFDVLTQAKTTRETLERKIESGQYTDQDWVAFSVACEAEVFARDKLLQFRFDLEKQMTEGGDEDLISQLAREEETEGEGENRAEDEDDGEREGNNNGSPAVSAGLETV